MLRTIEPLVLGGAAGQASILLSKTMHGGRMKPSIAHASPSLFQTDTAAEQKVSSPAAGATTAPTLTIGARVRMARLAAHQTQQQLAGEAYSKSYLSAVERGKMIPSFQALNFLAQRLGLPVS